LERSRRLRLHAREPDLASKDGLAGRGGRGDGERRAGALSPAAPSVSVAIRRAVAHPPLTSAQEHGLLLEYRQGRAAGEQLASAGADACLLEQLRMLVAAGELARETLIGCHVRVVMSIASAYEVEGLDLADLVQEGVTGLMRALEKFDEARGVRFVSYAVWWVRQAIQRAIDNCTRTIRLPVHLCELTRELALAEDRCWREQHREPTIQDLAADLNVEPAQAAFVKRVAQTPLPLERDDDRARSVTLLGVQQPPLEELVIEAERTRTITEAVEQLLRRRERDVLRLRFGLGDEREHTLEEVGRTFGMTRERVRQIQVRAIEGLAEDRPLQSSILGPPPGEPSERERRVKTREALLRLVNPAARRQRLITAQRRRANARLWGASWPVAEGRPHAR
jgi:RNA polymerase primary sigma factor